MGKSKETMGKKEVKNKQAKKRKDKEQRRLEKKESGTKNTFESMIAWVDENGMISSSPPDPSTRKVIDAKNIEIGIPKSEFRDDKGRKIRRGKVTNFDDHKGFGFISDSQTRESVFVHINDTLEDIRSNDMVEFEIEKGPRGNKAKNVKLIQKLD